MHGMRAAPPAVMPPPATRVGVGCAMGLAARSMFARGGACRGRAAGVGGIGVATHHGCDRTLCAWGTANDRSLVANSAHRPECDAGLDSRGRIAGSRLSERHG